MYSRPDKGTPDWDSRAAARKSDYVFLEAQSQFNLDKIDLYARLLQRAFDLDSADSRLAAELGQLNLIIHHDDSVEVQRSVDRIRRYYTAHPDNYYMGMTLANAYTDMHLPDSVLAVCRMLYNALPGNDIVARHLAEAYIHRGGGTDIDSAIAIYRKLEEAYGTSVDNNINSYIIGAYMRCRDTVGVISELERLYNSAPEDTHTVLTVANSMLQLDRPDQALHYLKLADSINPDAGENLLVYLDYYDFVGDTLALAETVRRAVVNPELDPDDKFSMLRIFISDNMADSTNFELNRELCENFISHNPGESQIHVLYAAALEANGYKTEAAEQMSYAVALEPSNIRYRMMYLGLLADLGKYDQAEAEGKKYISEMPGDLNLVRTTAAILYQQDKYREAFELLEQFPVDSLKTSSEQSDYYMITGDFAAKLEPRSLSYPYYLKAIELNPDNDMVLNNLAYFYSLDGEPEKLDEAEKYSAISIRRQPGNPTFLDTYAWIMFKKKQYAEARIYIDKVLEIYGLFPAIPAQSGDGSADRSSAAVGSTTPADGFEEVAVDDGTASEFDEQPSAEVYDHAGDIYFMSGEPAQALAFWRKALELEPDNELIKKKVQHKTYFFE